MGHSRKENSQHACDTGLCPRPKGKAVIQYNIDYNELGRFDSLKEASEATGANPDTITLVCKGKRNKSGGYKWKW
uniref:NUMOD1 domain protein n=1 Tax=Marseillevirus LCMAC101 TaxID=2506602 RepID=A0A481YRJ8_9VIRU|nr:MAG: NUMOD1 domain protein [Marseillevirus LCMAC101]